MELSAQLLESKLKRHKFSFTYDDNNKMLCLSNSSISLGAIIAYIFIPIIFLVVVAAFTFLNLRVLSVWQNLAMLIPVILVVVFSIRVFRQKIKKSKSLKIFCPDRFVIVDGSFRMEVPLADMQGIEKSLTDNDHSLGDLLLVTNKRNYMLLSLFDETGRYMEDDLDFFKKYLNELWFAGKEPMYA